VHRGLSGVRNGALFTRFENSECCICGSNRQRDPLIPVGVERVSLVTFGVVLQNKVDLIVRKKLACCDGIELRARVRVSKQRSLALALPL